MAQHPAAPSTSRGRSTSARRRSTSSGQMLTLVDSMTGLHVSAIYTQVLDIWRGDADYLSYLKTVVKMLPGGSAVAQGRRPGHRAHREGAQDRGPGAEGDGPGEDGGRRGLRAAGEGRGAAERGERLRAQQAGASSSRSSRTRRSSTQRQGDDGGLDAAEERVCRRSRTHRSPDTGSVRSSMRVDLRAHDQRQAREVEPHQHHGDRREAAVVERVARHRHGVDARTPTTRRASCPRPSAPPARTGAARRRVLDREAVEAGEQRQAHRQHQRRGDGLLERRVQRRVHAVLERSAGTAPGSCRVPERTGVAARARADEAGADADAVGLPRCEARRASCAARRRPARAPRPARTPRRAPRAPTRARWRAASTTVGAATPAPRSRRRP